MICAVDGYEANAPGRVGVGRYAFELLRQFALLQQKTPPPFTAMRTYVPGVVCESMPEESRAFVYRSVPVKPLWTFAALPAALSLDMPRADVVFSPTHYVPRWSGIPKVMAIMDVSYLTYPELFRREDLHKLVNWTAYSVAHAARIVTISQFSKRAIIDAYKVPESNVVVAYPALTELISEDGERMRTTPNTLPKRYILSVGTLQPRKNFSRLIEAFASLPDRECALVIAGKKGWLYEEILQAPKKHAVADRVYFLDYVDDGDLPGLYKHAQCFVLPSLYEGFGLPVLEAMAYGVPVVVSNSSSLPEIAGKAGIYVDPMDVQSIAVGLATALSERRAARSQRVALGKKRVKEFSWESAAKTVMDTLVSVAKEGKKG